MHECDAMAFDSCFLSAVSFKFNLLFCLFFFTSPLFIMALVQPERKLPFGKIEPNSAKYFYSCMFGGIIGKLRL
jgi:hypothetical protein